MNTEILEIFFYSFLGVVGLCLFASVFMAIAASPPEKPNKRNKKVAKRGSYGAYRDDGDVYIFLDSGPNDSYYDHNDCFSPHDGGYDVGGCDFGGFDGGCDGGSD